MNGRSPFRRGVPVASHRMGNPVDRHRGGRLKLIVGHVADQAIFRGDSRITGLAFHHRDHRALRKTKVRTGIGSRELAQWEIRVESNFLRGAIPEKLGRRSCDDKP